MSPLRRRLAFGGLAALGAVALGLGAPLPDGWFADVESRRVLDRHGGVLAEQAVPNRGKDRWVELDEVAPVVVQALLAAEDDRFHGHAGVDPRAIGRALIANLQAGEVVQGGSTLTQQTARLLAGRPPGWRGKAVEAWRAVRLDAHASKDEILTWYLNRAYFGHGAWGIEQAAARYFDETAAGLSLAEAATLVALLPSPTALDPWEDPDAARAGRDRVLDRLEATGRAGSDALARARAEPLQLRTRSQTRRAPHLSAWLLEEHADRAELRTTIDPVLQRDVEELARAQVASLAGRDIDHVAVLVLDAQTAEVRAWVGSADFAAEDGQVDGVRALRSPGSALKPLIYALAFERGLAPADAVPDVPRTFPTSHGSWAPSNYSDDFRGPVRAREALASSLNLPAVNVLEQVGVATAQYGLEQAGVHTLTERPAHYGLGLALGDGEVSLAELTAAYATLASGGTYRPIRVLADEPPAAGVRVFDARAAWLVTDVLADPVARLPAFGRWGPLERPYAAAAKTGTSTGFRDNWTVGYTSRHVVGVWAGNFDGRPMGQVSGITGAAPLWAEVMDRVTDEPVGFDRPKGLLKRKACALSGLRPSEHCPHVVEDWYPKGDAKRASCDWHLVVEIDPDTGLAAQGCKGAVQRTAVRWPAAYAAWAAEAGQSSAPASSLQGCTGAPPPRDEPAHIAYPGPGAVFHVDADLPGQRQRIPLRAAAPSGSQRAVWRVDGELLAEVGPPFEALWPPANDGLHRIELEIDGRPASRVDVWVAGLGP